MNNIGEISLSDYNRIIGRPRRSLLSFLGKVAGITAVLLLCSAAGDYVGPWTGKRSRTLSLTEAASLLQNSSAEQWELEMGMGAAQRHIMQLMDRIKAMAAREDKVGEYASVYLVNITRHGLAELKQLTALGVHQEQIENGLTVLLRDISKR